MSPEEITLKLAIKGEIFKMKPGQGDIIIITVPAKLSLSQMMALLEKVGKFFPANEVLVLDGGTKIQITEVLRYLEQVPANDEQSEVWRQQLIEGLKTNA